MEQINNDETIKECSKILGHQMDNKPVLDTSKIILTAEVNPKLLRRINYRVAGIKATTGSSTVATTDATKDTYLTNFTFSIVKDATCDAGSGAMNLQCVQDGQTISLLSLPLLTLTAQQAELSMHLTSPLKVDKNSIITISTTNYTVGLMVRTVNVLGYTVENQTSL